jgi:hypothetical protein
MFTNVLTFLLTPHTLYIFTSVQKHCFYKYKLKYKEFEILKSIELCFVLDCFVVL